MAIDIKYAGGAVQTTVSGTMTPTVPGAGGTFTVADATGYPASGRFCVKLNRGLSDEEHVLITSRSGAVFTVAQRGYDGTTAQNHDNPTCEIYFDATSANLIVDHVDDIEATPHATKLPVGTTAGHDVTARHTFGAALGTPGTPAVLTPDIAGAAGVGTVPARSDHVHNVPAAVPSSIGTANAEGAGASFARNDHIHELGAGSIDAAPLFAAGVVDAAALGANAVTTAKILDANVTLAKMASEAATSFDPDFDLNSVTLGTGGVQYGFSFKIGRIVVGVAGFALGTGGDVTATNIAFQLPYPVQDRTPVHTVFDNVSGWMTAARARDDSAGAFFSALGIISTAGPADQARAYATAGASSIWDSITPFNWGVNDSFQAFFFYEATS